MIRRILCFIGLHEPVKKLTRRKIPTIHGCADPKFWVELFEERVEYRCRYCGKIT